MSIILSNKSKEYIEKNKISHLLIRVSFFTEGCILIKEPKIEIVNEKDMKKYKDHDKIMNENLTLLISNDFREIFDQKNKFCLDLGGTFKKKIILKNFQPIIIRTCKVDN